jgi:hypothetical protein
MLYCFLTADCAGADPKRCCGPFDSDVEVRGVQDRTDTFEEVYRGEPKGWIHCSASPCRAGTKERSPSRSDALPGTL